MSAYLNIFHSYSQGEFGDLEKEKILENNVTRALIVTLKNAPVASQYLLDKLFGIEFSEEMVYELQTTLDTLSDEDELPEKWRNRFVLAIEPQKGKVRQHELPDILIRKVAESLNVEAGRAKLQKLINELINEAANSLQQEEKAAEHEHRINDIANLLQLSPDSLRDLDSSDLRYLYDLTRRSLPDAIIMDKKQGTVILVESKINGNLINTQIRRHISNNFGHDLFPRYAIYSEEELTAGKDEVCTCVCSWRDIYSLLNSFCNDCGCQSEPVGDFLVRQFLEYLERITIWEN